MDGCEVCCGLTHVLHLELCRLEGPIYRGAVAGSSSGEAVVVVVVERAVERVDEVGGGGGGMKFKFKFKFEHSTREERRNAT